MIAIAAKSSAMVTRDRLREHPFASRVAAASA
jgi:hypothetical protein